MTLKTIDTPKSWVTEKEYIEYQPRVLPLEAPGGTLQRAGCTKVSGYF